MSNKRTIIIGAGAGGSAAAAALCENGTQVLLIDAGPEYDPQKDYRLDQSDWETVDFPYKAHSKGDYRFDVGQPLDEAHEHLRSWTRVGGPMNTTGNRQVSGLGYYHVRGLGGSTLRFTGEAHRLNRHAMRMQSRFGVAADWPLDYDELEPWYRQAEARIGVAGPSESPDRPGNRDHLQPSHPIGSAGQCLADGAERLNLSWVPNHRAALSRPADGRPACNYCGNCNRGCPRLDKGSADITFLRQARATGNIEIRQLTRATRLQAHPNDGRIVAIDLLGHDGHEERLEVDGPVILAAGAIETPRLLLTSADKHFPDGLANGSGQVGRNLMDTLHCSVSAIAPLELASYKALPSDSICWDYNRPDSIPGVIGGCRFSAATNEIGLSGPIAYAHRAVAGFGSDFKRQMQEAFGQAVSVGAIGESLPNERAFVDLHPVDRDAQNQPIARIHAHLTDSDLKRLDFMHSTCRKLLAAAGLDNPFEQFSSYDQYAVTHVFGTCRMGTNPAQSVCNRHQRSHDHPNLFITDASVFPSSGGGESPSLTISALALRVGTQLSE